MNEDTMESFYRNKSLELNPKEIKTKKTETSLNLIHHYDVSSSITSASGYSASKPESADSSAYTRHQIFVTTEKISDKVTVLNDGPGTLQVIVYHNTNIFSDEFPLYEGEYKVYNGVYEIKVRSDTVGLNYRITDYEILQQTAVSKAEKIEVYSTDKDVHFTGAIVMNAEEQENLTGLLSNRYMIRGVNIQSIQPLKYRLIFWSSDQFSNVDLDLDYYIDDVELDMSASPAFRINGVNQYYLNVGGLEIIYEDFDITRELHISLQNESAIAKIAGALGTVQLDIKMSPRL